jgi:ferredoxin
VRPGFEQLKKKVIDKGLCTACGTCAGVCPKHVLEMIYVRQGSRQGSGLAIIHFLD